MSSKINNENVSEVAARLKELRLKLGISHEAFGLKCGYSASHLIHFEKGLYQPTVEMLMRVCKAFNVSQKWLIEGDQNVSIFTEGNAGWYADGQNDSLDPDDPDDFSDSVDASDVAPPERVFTLDNREYIASAHSSKELYYAGKLNKKGIGKRILSLRLERVLTQQAFSQKAGLTGPTICSLEAGKRALTEETANRIGHAFGVGVDWLYYGDEMAKQWPLDAEMIKWINSHPEARRKIKNWMNQ